MAEIAEYVMVDSSNYTLRQYSYDNHAFPEWTSGIIWRDTSCDGLPAPVDLISFQSGSEVTDWHGSFSGEPNHPQVQLQGPWTPSENCSFVDDRP